MKIKRKGVYQYEGLGFHQNQSALVIPKAAEAYMLKGIDIEQFIDDYIRQDPEKHKWDFMLRTKVPRNSRLVLKLDDGSEEPLQNICRYYPSTFGGKLIKYMPPLAGKEDKGERALGLDKNYKVLCCNDADDFDFKKIDLSYFYNEAKKLIVGVDHLEDLDNNTDIDLDEGEDE